MSLPADPRRRSRALSRRALLRTALGGAAALAASAAGRAGGQTPPTPTAPPAGTAPGPAPAAPGSTAPATPAQPAGPAPPPTLSLLTWENYAPRALVQRFQKETGIQVTVATTGSNADMLSRVNASRAAYDLVQPGLPFIPDGVARGLYQPLDRSRVPNAKHVIPAMLYAADGLGGVVADTRYGLPFDWGAEGIAYNTRRLSTRPDSWGVLHDPAHAGRLSYRASFPVFVATGLWMGLGNRMQDLYWSLDAATALLDRVLARLAESRSLVLTHWKDGDQIETLLGKEEVDVAQAWDGTVWRLAARGKPVKFVAPREGALAWMDGFAIPAGARNLEAAYAWINFMYEPRNAAAFNEDSGYGTVVAGAPDALGPAVRARFTEAFAPADLERFWWYRAEPPWWRGLFARYVARLRAVDPDDEYAIEAHRAERGLPGDPSSPGAPAPAGSAPAPPAPAAPAPPAPAGPAGPRPPAGPPRSDR
jgi:spermidine/putrescine transport system substrate-binding protein